MKILEIQNLSLCLYIYTHNSLLSLWLQLAHVHLCMLSLPLSL